MTAAREADLAERPVPEIGELHAAARALLEKLDAKEVTLVTAESCTGGFLASLATDIEGLSHAFDRGFVTYTKDAKQELLGVDAAMLDREGAVSEPVARAMAEGCLARSGAGLALAITGFAGSSDPAEDEGPGVTYVGVALPGRTTVTRIDYGKRERRDIRNLVSLAALELGLKALR
ncbi:CinA family protein [Erythrobacter sp. NE805]|uniref:CinA family protein n=1 Tax=Erythrobacter sp. NE805 TaxID=3389875 RepID=UPI00396B22B3